MDTVAVLLLAESAGINIYAENFYLKRYFIRIALNVAIFC